MSNPGSQKVELILKLVRAFEMKNMDFLETHVHKDYRRITYPRSLGKAEQTGEEWLQDSAEIMNLWTGDGKASYTSSYLNLFS